MSEENSAEIPPAADKSDQPLRQIHRDGVDYTIIGKEVNLTARLESNSESGKILISENTYKLIKDHIRCEPREAIRVKGIDRDIMTYWAVEYQKDFDEHLEGDHFKAGAN